MKTAKEKSKVKVHYTGTLKNGEVFDSSEGNEPLEFTVGEGQVIPGFDNGVKGMEQGEEKTINIMADDAYGQVREELIIDVDKNALPENIKPEVGLKLVSRTQDGKEIPVIVTEVKDSTITVDANHPLAGEDLTFNVKMVDIQ